MNEDIVFITGKDLDYQPDRDGGVSLFEKYIDFLIDEQKRTIHYLTAIGYSGGEDVEQKRIFQSQNKNLNPKNGLHIHRVDIKPNIDLEKYKKAKDNFIKRLIISEAESKSWELEKLNINNVSRIHIFHVSHAIDVVLNNTLPIEKIVLHPMMTGIGYKKYKNVPVKYMEQEKRVFKKVKVIQTPSLNEKDYLVNYYGVDPSKIIINSRGYDEKRFLSKERNLPKEGEPINIICANMIRTQKGQKYFIPFAELCRDNNIPVKIQLIGVNGDSYDELYKKYYLEIKEEIKKRSLEDFFIFHDVMLPEELNKIMLSSHLSIITSQYETFGKSALESSATGIPTIVFDDVDAFQEFITNDINGIITKRDFESRNLFNSFIKLINNQDLYESISKNGITKGTSYSWNGLFSQMESDINSKINKIGQ